MYNAFMHSTRRDQFLTNSELLLAIVPSGRAPSSLSQVELLPYIKGVRFSLVSVDHPEHIGIVAISIGRPVSHLLETVACSRSL